MGDPFSGAAVGVLFAEVFILIKDAVKTTVQFRSRLENLQTTFVYIQPIINQIDIFNDKLDRPNEEIERLHKLMTDGKFIIVKSSKVTTLNFYKRYRYSQKLADLDDQIVKFFQIYTLLNSRDTKALVDVKEIKQMLAAIHKLSLTPEGGWSNKGTKGPVSESCAVPKAPEFVVGLDGSIQQLKSRLLTGGVSVIVVSAPGGCGKTTLVKTLSHNPDIKGKFKNNIFFVTFAETPNFTAIVQNMINHMGKNVPQIGTEKEGINELQKLLEETCREGPVLLVIDDVWSDSESLLKNFWFEEILDYKIVVTLRSDLSSFGTPHKLNPLRMSLSTRWSGAVRDRHWHSQ